MPLVYKYMGCIHRNRSAIWTQTNWVWFHDWISIMWHVVMRMLCYDWMRLCWQYWIRIIRMVLMWMFSFHTPLNSFLRKYWMVNV